MKIVVSVLIVLALTGCALFSPPPPTVNAGYYLDMQKDSKPSILIGTNNSQANAIHAALPGMEGGGTGTPAEADKSGNTAKSSGLFVNNNVGDRSADVDATAALEMLKDVQGTSAGQSQTTSKGDSSPSTGTQSQTPSNTQTTTTNIPTAVGQSAPTATVNPGD